MKNRLFTSFTLFFLSFMIVHAQLSNDNQRQTYNFNSDWKLMIGDFPEASQPDYNDALWLDITLPRAFNEDEAFRLHIASHTDTIVWYRKHFRIPSRDRGKKIFLEFEGVRFGADVFLNGKHVALHENGVMAFGVDISEVVDFDKENVIAVRTDNNWRYRERATNSTWQWNDRNFNANYGGIPKNVMLHATGRVYQTLPLYSNLQTTGTYIYAKDFNISRRRAVIHAESEVRNETSSTQTVGFEVVIKNPDAVEVARFRGNPLLLAPGATGTLQASSLVRNLHFWSWGYGYLYDVYTILKIDGKDVDIVRTRTGFRKTEFRGGLVLLNDRVIQMKGYAQRTSNEWPGVGLSVAPRISDYSNRLIVEGNGNMVRWMHVAPWKQDVESCDRVGLMQMFPAGDAESDVTGRRWEQRVELMRDAIIYNRNNPSVILWESGNKGVSEEHMREMKAVRDKYDPHGGRASGSREMLDSREAEWGGEMLYVNKHARIPMIANEYSRDEALRKYWDDFTPPYHKDGEGPMYRDAPAQAYNRNQDSFAKEAVMRWYDFFEWRAGNGKRVSSGGLNIIFSDTNTHCRGEENYRRSGETDAMRIPKDAYYAHQVMWDGWVDLENFRTYIIGHWNYAPGTVKDIMVVSPSEEVELFLNGMSLGIGERSYYSLHTFKDVAYQPGQLKAISRTAKGKLQSEALKETTGKPVALKLTLVDNSGQIRADGADMALVQVEVVDAMGRRCPDVHPLVTFDIQGPADWRGGIGQGPDNYVLSKVLPAEAGVNRALIRSTTIAGTIRVSVDAEGLKSDAISFETLPFLTENGLSEVLPSAGLPINLSRGETPSTPSYRDTHKSIEITGAAAGSNQETVHLSWDDNERTEWSNDGNLDRAYITYRFAGKSKVSEVSMKVSGFRTRRYPIEILAGNRLLWSGNTPLNLGYNRIRFDEVRTDEITIRLTGAGSAADSFNNIVELAGHVEQDGASRTTSTGNNRHLRIVEIDFYQVLK